MPTLNTKTYGPNPIHMGPVLGWLAMSTGPFVARAWVKASLTETYKARVHSLGKLDPNGFGWGFYHLFEQFSP